MKMAQDIENRDSLVNETRETQEPKKPFHKTRRGRIGALVLAAAAASGGLVAGITISGGDESKPVKSNEQPQNQPPKVTLEDLPVAANGEIIDVKVPLPNSQVAEKYPDFKIARDLLITRWWALRTNNVFLLRETYYGDESNPQYQEDLENMRTLGPLGNQIIHNPEYLRIDGFLFYDDYAETGYAYADEEIDLSYNFRAFLKEEGGKWQIEKIETA